MNEFRGPATIGPGFCWTYAMPPSSMTLNLIKSPRSRIVSLWSPQKTTRCRSVITPPWITFLPQFRNSRRASGSALWSGTNWSSPRAMAVAITYYEDTEGVAAAGAVITSID